MNPRTLVVGNASVDTVVTEDGVLYPRLVGGNAFHASMSASIFSKDTAIVSVIPRNFPKEVLKIFTSRGVDLSGLRVVDMDVMGQEVFIYDHRGDRIDAIYTLYEGSDDPRSLSLEQIERLKQGSVPAGTYTFADFRREYRVTRDQIPTDWELSSLHIAPTSWAAVDEISRLDVPVKTLDPGAYIKGFSEDAVLELLGRLTVFMPSKKELGWIYPELSPLEGLKRLAQGSGRSIICKNGKQGALLFDIEDQSIYRIGTYPAVVKDYTGAGDFFCGAVNTRLSVGDSLLEAARVATVTSARAIEHMSVGSRQVLDRSSILAAAGSVEYEKLERL